MDIIAGSMAGKTKVKPLPPDDLEAVVRETVAAAPGVKKAQLKKALPLNYQSFAAQAQSMLGQLADRGEIHRLASGKTESFFSRDPLAVLNEVLPKALPAEPLGKVALKALVGKVASGHEAALDFWIKAALEQRLLFDHGPLPKSKEKRYAREPDIRKNLAAVFTALKKALTKTDQLGVSRQRVAEALLDELGVPMTSSQVSPAAEKTQSAHELFRAAMRAVAQENPRQALLSVREVRAHTTLYKTEFDSIALELMRDGELSLHRHDHPASLTESELSQLVRDARGNYYIGIAPRSGQ